MTDELVGESSVDGNFFMNGTMPPLVVKPPYHSMYWLVITTGNMLDINDTMDITFNLSVFINTSDIVSMMLISNVTLHKIGTPADVVIQDISKNFEFEKRSRDCNKK